MLPSLCLPRQPSLTEQDLPSWYVVQTLGRHESRVERALREKGLQVYLPCIRVPSRRRDRGLLLNQPLFPGYLFIHDALETSIYREIVKVSGVVRILGEKGRPQPVPETLVESVKLVVASNRPYYPHRCLMKGSLVRVAEGPLAGVVGIIREHRGKKRKVVIEVELFRRALAVELEDERVEPWHYGCPPPFY